MILIQSIMFGIFGKAVIIYGFFSITGIDKAVMRAMLLAVMIELIDCITPFIIGNIKKLSELIKTDTDIDVKRVLKSVYVYKSKGGNMPATIVASQHIIQKIFDYSATHTHVLGGNIKAKAMFDGCFVRLGSGLEKNEFYIENSKLYRV